MEKEGASKSAPHHPATTTAATPGSGTPELRRLLRAAVAAAAAAAPAGSEWAKDQDSREHSRPAAAAGAPPPRSQEPPPRPPRRRPRAPGAGAEAEAPGASGARDEMSPAYSSSSEPPGWTEESWGAANASANSSVNSSAATSVGTTLLASVAAAASGYVSGLVVGPTQAGGGGNASSGTPSLAAALATALVQNATKAANETVVLPAAPAFCEGWEAVQNNFFQVANLFYCIAFLVPRHMKQSVLLYRFLLAMGSLLTAAWASFHLCAFDVFLWNTAFMAVNTVYTVMLVVRFLPPALSPDLTELYLKVFRPLKVSKKAFKELAREGAILTLEAGDTYAIEEQTPADERLSILLKGKLAVTCDGTHLHHINIHQFVDSPEWEANHDTSENTFQVTISAEEDSVCLCWPRMKLSRVLRHRPQVRIVLDTLIGKDITHKLYSLNEHMHGAGEAARRVRSDRWRRNGGRVGRSVSVDAVNTGTSGHVRSSAFKHSRAAAQQVGDVSDVLQSPARAGHAQCWIPLVANHFPVTSPFADAQGQPQPLTAAAANAPAGVAGLGAGLGAAGLSLPLTAGMPLTAGIPGVQGVPMAGVPVSGVPGMGLQVPSSMALVPVPVIVPVLAPPPTLHQARSRSMRRVGVGAGGVGTPAGGVKFEATPV